MTLLSLTSAICLSVLLPFAVWVGFECLGRRAKARGGLLRRSRGRLFRTNLLAAVASLCLLSVSVISLAGCTPQQKQTTLQVMTQINAQMPAVIAGGDMVAATVSALAPADAALIQIGDFAFDAAARTLQSLVASYVANPNASVLAQIQAAINALESNLNTATLQALGIKNTTSQQLAIASLKGLLTVVTVIFGLISPTETKAQLFQLRETDTIHLARVRPYMDERVLQAASRDAGVDLDAAFGQAIAFGF